MSKFPSAVRSALPQASRSGLWGSSDLRSPEFLRRPDRQRRGCGEAHLAQQTNQQAYSRFYYHLVWPCRSSHVGTIPLLYWSPRGTSRTVFPPRTDAPWNLRPRAIGKVRSRFSQRRDTASIPALFLWAFTPRTDSPLRGPPAPRIAPRASARSARAPAP